MCTARHFTEHLLLYRHPRAQCLITPSGRPGAQLHQPTLQVREASPKHAKGLLRPDVWAGWWPSLGKCNSDRAVSTSAQHLPKGKQEPVLRSESCPQRPGGGINLGGITADKAQGRSPGSSAHCQPRRGKATARGSVAPLPALCSPHPGS